MRKNIKNDKVLRAITIGLATMIAATSAPITVLADDGDTDGADIPAASEASEAHESHESHESHIDSVYEEGSSQEQVDHSNDSDETKEIHDEQEAVEEVYETSYPDVSTPECPGVVAPIDTAINAVDQIVPVVNQVEAGTGDAIKNLLTYESDDFNEMGALQLAQAAGTDLKNAIVDLGQAYDSAALAEQAAERAAAKLITKDNNGKTEIEKKFGKFEDSSKTTTDDANTTIDSAKAANDENATKKEAYEAADKAYEYLDKTEDGLVIAEFDYEAAETAYNYAKEDVEKARKERDNAQDKLDEARDLLEDANINATASHERLKAAEAQLNEISDKLEKLEKMEDQYEKLMVHYFRVDTKTPVYNDDGKLNVKDAEGDGTLNFEKSAQEAKDKNKISGTLDEKTMRLSRELMTELIEYKLEAKDDVVPGSIKIGEYEEGMKDSQKKIANEGYWDTDTSNKNFEKEKVSLSDKDNKEIWFSSYESGNSGRGHCVKVTYEVKTGEVDEDGNEITKTETEYYNYIIKGSNVNDTKDIEKGPIFLAQIDTSISATSEDRVIRDTDPNNFDDFSRLTKVVDDYNKVKKNYEDAQKAVEEADKKVTDLQDQIKDLEVAKEVSEEKVVELEGKLEEATQAYEAAKDNKDTLEKKVQEARDAVDAIDLSRFKDNTVPADDDDPVTPVNPAEDPTDGGDDDTDPEPGDGPAIVVPPSDIVVPTPSVSPVPAVLPEITGFTGGTVAPTSGVLGVRVDEADIVENPAAPKLVASLKNPKITKAPKANKNSKLVKIEDNEVPLAAMPEEDGINMSWWWLLLIVLLGAAGKKMYDEHQKKLEAKKAQEAAEAQKTDR